MESGARAAIAPCVALPDLTSGIFHTGPDGRPAAFERYYGYKASSAR
jgi:hypothetical protein